MTGFLKDDISID